jgi:hypothetical protein
MMPAISHTLKTLPGQFKPILSRANLIDPFDDHQKKNFRIIAALGILYFILLAIPNAHNAVDEHMLFVLSQDENIQYPYVLRMVTPDETIIETLTQFVAYQHYFYGYPFYFLSALVLLPVRFIFGDQMAAHTQLNLFLLRQLVNVLPMTLSLILLVYLQTRFRSRWRSIVLFSFLAFIPVVFRSNVNWWHPDSLAVLFVVLTLFFLERDRLKFANHFKLAAVCVGLTVGTKVFGFFFFTVIGGYLLTGLLKHVLDIKKAMRAALVFIVLMIVTIIVSNPMLLHSPSRQRIIETQAKQNYEVTHGWDKAEEADQYGKGFRAWLPYLEKWFAPASFLGFVFLSILVGCLWGRQTTINRLILGWVITYGSYILLAVAIKNDHYWLPVMVPFFSGVLITTERGDKYDWLVPLKNPRTAKLVSGLVVAVVIVGVVLQLAVNIAADAMLYNNAMIAEYLLMHNINP